MNMKDRKIIATTQETITSASEKTGDAFASVNVSLMKALDQNRMIAQNMMRAMQEESLRFMNTRLEHTSRAFERSRDCQGISALITLQHDWLLDVARDYAELNKRFSDVLHVAAEHGAETASELPVEAARSPKPEAMNERAMV